MGISLAEIDLWLGCHHSWMNILTLSTHSLALNGSPNELTAGHEEQLQSQDSNSGSPASELLGHTIILFLARQKQLSWQQCIIKVLCSTRNVVYQLVPCNNGYHGNKLIY